MTMLAAVLAAALAAELMELLQAHSDHLLASHKIFLSLCPVEESRAFRN